MLFRVAQLSYLMAPAYVANMAPPFTRFMRAWNQPISERRLGSHKTILGAAVGVAGGVITAAAQTRVRWSGSIIAVRSLMIAGLLLGVGAIGGDLVKSFAKRTRGIPPGTRWMPFDQLDFVVGALILVQPIARLSLVDTTVVLLISFVADVVVNQVAFRLQIRERPW